MPVWSYIYYFADLSQMQRLYAMQMSFVLSVCLSVCLFVCLSPVKLVESFATWQYLSASGAYRIKSDTLVTDTDCCLFAVARVRCKLCFWLRRCWRGQLRLGMSNDPHI